MTSFDNAMTHKNFSSSYIKGSLNYNVYCDLKDLYEYLVHSDILDAKDVLGELDRDMLDSYDDIQYQLIDSVSDIVYGIKSDLYDDKKIDNHHVEELYDNLSPDADYLE